MARHVLLATVAAAAALAIWWGLRPSQIAQAQPAVQSPPQPPAQAVMQHDLQQRSGAAAHPAPAMQSDAAPASTAPLEHASGDDPAAQYALREDEGVLRRVAYQPEPKAMDNPFGARAWGERPALPAR